jgi:hypothetical protein
VVAITDKVNRGSNYVITAMAQTLLAPKMAA